MRNGGEVRQVISRLAVVAVLATTGTAAACNSPPSSRVAPESLPELVLSLDQPTAGQAVPPGSPETRKFVQVQVRQVVNPTRIPMTFAVAFVPAEGPVVQLGTFSLFPPDNPGTFLVATRNRLRPDGRITVTVTALEKASAQVSQGLRVHLAITLRD